MKWKIIPILIASFILVQCRSNKAGLQEALKTLSAEVKEIENVARTGNKDELAKLPVKIKQVNKDILQYKKDASADPQIFKELESLQQQTNKLNQGALPEALETRISFETRVNELSESIIQESRDVFTSEDESELRAFLKRAICKEFNAKINNEPMTNSDYEELVAQTFLPPNKQKELSDKIDKIMELCKSISEGSFDDTATSAIQAYC